MASLEVRADRVKVRLTRFERLLTMPGDLEVPRTTIRRVESVDDPMSRVRGFRAPGTGVAWLIAYGTYRGRGWKEFSVVRRGQRAIRVSLVGHEFDAIVVGMDDPERTANEIRGYGTLREC